MYFTIRLTFYNWNGLSKGVFENFVGLNNYLNLLKDPRYLEALKNTFIFVVFTVFFQNLFGFLFAVIIYYNNFRFNNIIRAIFFFPAAISPVIVTLIMRRFFIFDGLINKVISNFGGEPVLWLSNIHYVIWIITAINIWQWWGFNLLLYYAGLQSFNDELIEAAVIDGARRSTIVIRIILPVLKPIVILSTILTSFGAFKVFELVWVLSKGGPNYHSDVLTTYLYKVTFYPESLAGGNMGYGSTIGLSLMFFLIIVSIVRFNLMKERTSS
jgi:raffinose/stachyose/melibiose transport system permease protein